MVKDKEKIERVVLKLPKSVADYFRASFPHGKRSRFFVECVLDYKQKNKIKKLEEELGEINKHRK